jgi:hypothetical protein
MEDSDVRITVKSNNFTETEIQDEENRNTTSIDGHLWSILTIDDILFSIRKGPSQCQAQND